MYNYIYNEFYQHILLKTLYCTIMFDIISYSIQFLQSVGFRLLWTTICLCMLMVWFCPNWYLLTPLEPTHAHLKIGFKWCLCSSVYVIAIPYSDWIETIIHADCMHCTLYRHVLHRIRKLIIFFWFTNITNVIFVLAKYFNWITRSLKSHGRCITFRHCVLKHLHQL